MLDQTTIDLIRDVNSVMLECDFADYNSMWICQSGFWLFTDKGIIIGAMIDGDLYSTDDIYPACVKLAEINAKDCIRTGDDWDGYDDEIVFYNPSH